MAERYKQLFIEKECKYTITSPVLILAKALIWDNKNSNLIGQVKYKSIDSKEITALFVTIKGYSVAGDHVLDIPFEYLDLHVSRDTEFGDQTAIFLSNPNIRSFDVLIDKVVYSDKTLWEKKQDDTITIDSQTQLTLEPKLLEQYQRQTTKNSVYIPVKVADLWICSCGAINSNQDKQCHCCHCSKDLIFASLNTDTLTIENNKLQYSLAIQKMSSASSKEEFLEAKNLFESISTYLDSKELAEQCFEKAETLRIDSIYASAVEKLNSNNIEDIQNSITEFESIIQWRDAGTKKKVAEEKVLKLTIENQKKSRTKKISIIGLTFALIAFLLIYFLVIIPSHKYNLFLEACNSSNLSEIRNALSDLPATKMQNANDKLFELGSNNILVAPKYGKDYFDLITEDRATEICHAYFLAAKEASENGDRNLAKTLFNYAGTEGAEELLSIRYDEASEYLSDGQFVSAMNEFDSLGDYQDSPQKYVESEKGIFDQAISEINNKNFDEAEKLFSEISDYEEIAYGYDTLKYHRGLEKMNMGELKEALTFFNEIADGTSFSELNNNIQSCNDGIKYLAAVEEVIGLRVDDSTKVQPAINKINKALSMPIGASKSDYTDILNKELKYLEWYGKYVGCYDCISSEDPTVMSHGGYADKYVTIVLNGDSTACHVDHDDKFLNGSTTSEKGNFVLSGSNLKMKFNGYWSTFVLDH